jgi:hypothetical protein
MIRRRDIERELDLATVTARDIARGGGAVDVSLALLLALLALDHSTLRIARAVEKLAAAPPPGGPSLGHTVIHVVAVLFEEEPPMSKVDHMPDFTLPSTALRAVLAVVGPKKADGSYAGPGSWSKVDTAATAPADGSEQLTLEAIPDSVVMEDDGVTPKLDANGNQIPVYKVFANTPLEPEDGATAGGTVTWGSAGMADVDIKVTYGNPALGHAAITAAEAPEA